MYLGVSASTALSKMDPVTHEMSVEEAPGDSEVVSVCEYPVMKDAVVANAQEAINSVTTVVKRARSPTATELVSMGKKAKHRIAGLPRVTTARDTDADGVTWIGVNASVYLTHGSREHISAQVEGFSSRLMDCLCDDEDGSYIST